jgi:hypothetical protein
VKASRPWHGSVVGSVCLTVLVLGCSPTAITPSQLPAVVGSPTSTDLWVQLQESVSYPYTTPLPPAQVTVLDGTYGKFDPRHGVRPFCRRCMPYPPEGGLWLLRLDKGTYRIFSTRSLSGWRSVGSYTVTRDQLFLFNDPHCIDAVGRYQWDLSGGRLVLQVLEDECVDGFRGIAFTNYPWVVRDGS